MALLKKIGIFLVVVFVLKVVRDSLPPDWGLIVNMVAAGVLIVTFLWLWPGLMKVKPDKDKPKP